MAFRELSQLNKELYLRTQIEQLRRVYSAAQKSLVAQLSKINLTDFQKFRAQQLLKQVEEITAQLNNGVYKWAKGSLPYAYEQGIDLAAERLKAMNITRFVAYDAQIHTSAINALVQDVSSELIIANESMKKFFNRVVLQTQQTLLQDSEINRQIAEGLIQGDARRTISDKILQDLRTQMGEERFIVINGRNYRPDKYAELVARTRTREATSQGTINTALRYDVDLVQWDAHAEVCEYCQQFSGRVYSISGADEDFPQLTEKPPLHPNCRCVINPITRENLESRGYLAESIKLSNAPSIKVNSFSRFEELMATI
jgi:SPP1 gp7 family putative phage head morphogenesis protein